MSTTRPTSDPGSSIPESVFNKIEKMSNPKIPIVLNNHPDCNLTNLNTAYTIDPRTTVGTLMGFIRTKIALPPYKTLYLSIKDCHDTLPNASVKCGDLYLKYKSPVDNRLHLYYRSEDAYG